jgi:hypothetical protein
MDIKTLRRTKKYEEMRKPDTKIFNVFYELTLHQLFQATYYHTCCQEPAHI